MEECGYCSKKASEIDGELIDRPDLMDPYGEENPKTTKVCLHCESILESKKKYTFVCNQCFNEFDGLMVVHDAFGSFCKTCYADEEWERPSLTEIPSNGWTQADIGRHVYIMGEHGTIIPDIIICSTLPHGRTCIGPGSTIGGIIARMNHISEVSQSGQHPTAEISMHQLQQDAAEFFEHLFGQGGDDDEDDNVGFGDLIP